MKPTVFNPKMAWLSIAVSSCMALTACGGGGSSDSHAINNHIDNNSNGAAQNLPKPNAPTVSSVTTDPTSPMVGQTYQVTVHGTDLTNLQIDGCQSAKPIKANPTANPTQVTYQCTAPSTAQPLTLSIRSADGKQDKQEYHKAQIQIQANSSSPTPPVNPTPPIKAHNKLPTTGISLCGNDSKNNIACNQLSDDWKGLQQDGEVQAGQKMSHNTLNPNGAECVQDNVTGLIWEQKTDDGGLRDKDNKYTWYNPDSNSNGGKAGNQNGGKNTHEYIQKLNASNYCGHNDWRLPSRAELISIVNHSHFEPAINSIFTNTQSDFYWSSSPSAKDDRNVWVVNFRSGSSNDRDKAGNYYVRAVRSE